jgi:hypothetical protein
MWDVEFTNQFETWWDTLGASEQQAIDAAVRVLEQQEFYTQIIPIADRLFDEHLADPENEDTH